MSSPSKSDSDRPPATQATGGKEPSEIKVAFDPTSKPTLTFSTVVETENKSEPPNKHDSRQDVGHGGAPVPDSQNPARYAVTQPNRTIPLLPIVVKTRHDTNKAIAVPIKHISDRPQNAPHTQRDSDQPLAGQTEDNSKPKGEPLRPVETAAIKPVSSVSIRPVSLIKGQSSGRPVSPPTHPASAAPVQSSSTTDVSAMIAERNDKLNKVKESFSTPSSSTRVSTVTQETNDKPYKAKESFSKGSGKKKKNDRRKKQHGQTVLAEPSAPARVPAKSVSERPVPILRPAPTSSGVKWLVVGGLVVVSLSIVAIYWPKKPTPVNQPITQPKIDAFSSRQRLQEPVTPKEPATEIITNPSGAEVVSEGTVIGTTPTKIERSLYEQLVLLRKAGYEPTLVRISLSSRDVIHVDLKAVGESAKEPSTQPVPDKTKSSRKTK